MKPQTQPLQLIRFAVLEQEEFHNTGVFVCLSDLEENDEVREELLAAFDAHLPVVRNVAIRNKKDERKGKSGKGEMSYFFTEEGLRHFQTDIQTLCQHMLERFYDSGYDVVVQTVMYDPKQVLYEDVYQVVVFAEEPFPYTLYEEFKEELWLSLLQEHVR